MNYYLISDEGTRKFNESSGLRVGRKVENHWAKIRLL